MTQGAHSVLTMGPSATDDQKQVSASQEFGLQTRGKTAPHRKSRDLAGLGEREGVSKGLAPGLDQGGDTGPCFVERRERHNRGGVLLAGPHPQGSAPGLETTFLQGGLHLQTRVATPS